VHIITNIDNLDEAPKNNQQDLQLESKNIVNDLVLNQNILSPTSKQSEKNDLKNNKNKDNDKNNKIYTVIIPSPSKQQPDGEFNKLPRYNSACKFYENLSKKVHKDFEQQDIYNNVNPYYSKITTKMAKISKASYDYFGENRSVHSEISHKQMINPVSKNLLSIKFDKSPPSTYSIVNTEGNIKDLQSDYNEKSQNNQSYPYNVSKISKFINLDRNRNLNLINLPLQIKNTKNNQKIQKNYDESQVNQERQNRNERPDKDNLKGKDKQNRKESVSKEKSKKYINTNTEESDIDISSPRAKTCNLIKNALEKIQYEIHVEDIKDKEIEDMKEKEKELERLKDLEFKKQKEEEELKLVEAALLETEKTKERKVVNNYNPNRNKKSNDNESNNSSSKDGKSKGNQNNQFANFRPNVIEKSSNTNSRAVSEKNTIKEESEQFSESCGGFIKSPKETEPIVEMEMEFETKQGNEIDVEKVPNNLEELKEKKIEEEAQDETFYDKYASALNYTIEHIDKFDEFTLNDKIEILISLVPNEDKEIKLGAVVALYIIKQKYLAESIEIYNKNIQEAILKGITEYEIQDELFLVISLELLSNINNFLNIFFIFYLRL